MDKDLVEAARKLHAEHLFQLVRKCYYQANADYLEKQIEIAKEYMTEKQLKELNAELHWLRNKEGEYE